MVLLPTLLETAARLRRKELTPRQVVESCLARIEAQEPAIRAWVRVDAEGALREADRLGKELQQGHDRGPLHGIPIGIKDLVDIAGWPTLAGSALRTGHVATSDAPIVARLRAAGAIVLGKTVTTEWASFDPPPTRNPWNLDATPGGSSSGSAASVALGQCLAAIGSQTGGSITRPASFCGVASCKPTYGLVQLDGIVPLAWHIDHPGPMARRVADVAAMLQAIAVPPDDPFAAHPVVPDYLAAIGLASQPPRIGVIERFFLEECNDAVRHATREAIGRLHAAGAKTARVGDDLDIPLALQHHRCIMEVEAASYHRPHFPSQRERYSKHIAELLEGGRRRSGLEYAAALEHQAVFRRAMRAALNDLDVLLTPATVTPAPGLDSTGDPRFNGPLSYCGFPTVSLPCAVSEKNLPMSLQLIGRPYQEGKVFAAAAWCERVLDFRVQPTLADR